MAEPQPAHYFSSSPGAPSRPRSVRLTLPDRTLELATDAGVFAADAVDAGTKVLLLEAPAAPPTGTLLDLGCGYGPLAITLALRSPEATIWAVDVNDRARALCEANAASCSAANVRVAAPDDVPDDVRFDEIWSNPPIRIGKVALHELLLVWLDRLRPGGRANLVVQKHLGSDSLARWLDEQGFATARLASRQAYRVLQVQARP